MDNCPGADKDESDVSWSQIESNIESVFASIVELQERARAKDRARFKNQMLSAAGAFLVYLLFERFVLSELWLPTRAVYFPPMDATDLD